MKENDLLPLEKNRVRLDDDDDDDEEAKVGGARSSVPSPSPGPASSPLAVVCFSHCQKLLEEAELAAVIGEDNVTEQEAPPTAEPEEKRPAPSLEELEAKQGNSHQGQHKPSYSSPSLLKPLMKLKFPLKVQVYDSGLSPLCWSQASSAPFTSPPLCPSS